MPGIQLIAHVLGAPVHLAAKPEASAGTRSRCTSAGIPCSVRLHPPPQRFTGTARSSPVPPGSSCLASSAQTGCQAFRVANAWGVLFHPEADAALLRGWLHEPSMVREATAALGEHAKSTLLEGAAAHERALRERSTASFTAFARVIGERAGARPAA